MSLYFKERNLSQKGNFFLYAKSIFFMTLSVGAYILMINNVGGAWTMAGLYALMGLLIAIGTMNIAHDALHGSYLSIPKANRILGFTMDLCGASSFYWKKEHVVDHHTFTNIVEHDADLDVPFFLRVCPNAPRFSFHRFQPFYAPFLYALNLVRWVHFSDYRRLSNIFRHGRTNTDPSNLEIFFLLLFKAIHISLFVVIPMLVLPYAWWQILLSYLGLLATMGLTLTIIFQLAHIVEDVAFPLPNEEGKIDNNFFKHQFATTSNFATDSKLVSFLFGGLNFQVEHHVFPHISHVHLPKISPIVEKTAKEFGLPYHKNRTFFTAIRSHFRTLHKFGHS